MNRNALRNKVRSSVRSNSGKVEKALLTAGKSLIEVTTGITVGRVVDAVSKALTARSEAKVNEKYMKKHYGTEEAAAKTRGSTSLKAKKRTVKNSNLKQGYLLKH